MRFQADAPEILGGRILGGAEVDGGVAIKVE